MMQTGSRQKSISVTPFPHPSANWWQVWELEGHGCVLTKRPYDPLSLCGMGGQERRSLQRSRVEDRCFVVPVTHLCKIFWPQHCFLTHLFRSESIEKVGPCQAQLHR